MIGKKAKKKNIGVFIVTAIVIFGLFYIFAPTIRNSMSPATGNVQGTIVSGGGAATIITTSTNQTYVYSDAMSQGTAVGGTVYTSRAGGAFTTSITSVTQGEVMDLLVTNGTGATTGAASGRQYHNAWIPAHKVPNNIIDSINVKFYKNASVTVSMFNTNGDKMTNGGGDTNQVVAEGGSYNLKLRMDGQDKTNTQDMTCIFEASNKTAMDKVVLNGFNAKFVGTSVPSSYTVAGTGSVIWVYDIDPIVGATSPEGTVGIITKSGQDLHTSYLKVTCRTKEHFVDSVTGQHTYDIEDSSGTAQYLAQYTGTYYFWHTV